MIRFLTVALAMCSLAGCATITRGTRDVLVVNSNPQGAQVKLSNGESCTGPPAPSRCPANPS